MQNAGSYMISPDMEWLHIKVTIIPADFRNLKSLTKIHKIFFYTRSPAIKIITISETDW